MALFKKNGNWYIDYYCNMVRFRQKIGPSKKQAEHALAIKLSEIVQGTFKMAPKRKRIAFGVLAEKYLEYSRVNKRSYKADLCIMKNLNRFFGNRTIDQIDSHLIELYKIQRQQEIRARDKYRGKDSRDIPMTTINRELTCLKHMFNMAIRWGKAEHNPVKGIKYFKEESIVDRHFQQDEIDRLLRACNPYMKDMVLIALNTGMRIGEILKLEWERIDLQQGYITVTRTKSGKDRKIPINETVTKVLKSRERDGIYVFHADGKPYASVKKAFYAAQKRAGIRHCRFHDLRHHFATRLVLAGVSLPVVKELLGHSSIVTTMRYAHPTPEAKKEAVRLLEGGEMSNSRHYMDTSPLIAEIQSFITNST